MILNFFSSIGLFFINLNGTDMNKIRNLLLAIAILILPLALSGCQKEQANNASAAVAVSPATEVTYSGEDGKTVYDLLKSSHQVQADESSMGVLVKSIDGVSQTDKEFWLYDINGEQSNLGADKQMTKTGDQVHWQLKGF